MELLRRYVRLVDAMNERVGMVVRWLVPAMVCALTFEVAARYVFARPTLWVYDTAIFFYGYCGMLAGGYVLKHGGHITVDILYASLPRRRQAWLDVVSGLLFFFFIALVIIYGMKAALLALHHGDRTATEWGPPLAHFRFMVPLGAFLLLLQGVAKFIRDLHFALTERELDP